MFNVPTIFAYFRWAIQSLVTFLPQSQDTTCCALLKAFEGRNTWKCTNSTRIVGSLISTHLKVLKLLLCYDDSNLAKAAIIHAFMKELSLMCRSPKSTNYVAWREQNDNSFGIAECFTIHSFMAEECVHAWKKVPFILFVVTSSVNFITF